MKRIRIVVLVIRAFSISASAQQKTTRCTLSDLSPETAAVIHFQPQCS